MDCIYTRRSIRKYKDIPIEWETLGRIIEAGSFAPSAGNIQNYRFIVVFDEDKRKQIAQACLQQFWMEQAPIHVIVCAEIKRIKQLYGLRGDRLYTIQNTAAAVENILLAAHSFGLGGCWVGAFDETMIKRTVAIPDYARPHAIITLGYPDEVPAAPNKIMLESLYYIERYNNRIKNIHTVIGETSPTVAKAVRDTKRSFDKHTQKFFEKLKKKFSGHP